MQRYVDYMRAHGFYAEGIYNVGTDVVEEVTTLAKQVVGRYPHSVVFTGQLIFPGDTIATRLLHNYMSFAIQRQLYYEGIPVLVHADPDVASTAMPPWYGSLCPLCASSAFGYTYGLCPRAGPGMTRTGSERGRTPEAAT